MDGVTTNGILVMHLDGEQFSTNSKPTKWKEVSVGGSVFDLGEGRLKFNYQSTVRREHFDKEKIIISLFLSATIEYG